MMSYYSKRRYNPPADVYAASTANVAGQPYRGAAGYSREDDEGYSVPVDNGRTMTAKFAGKCRETGAAIRPGDTIRYIKGYGSVLVSSTTPAPETGRYVSDVFRTSGGTFYRNKAGRCEDAPCCGCCTI